MSDNVLADEVAELRAEVRTLRRWIGLMAIGIVSAALMGFAGEEAKVLKVDELRTKKLVVDDPDAAALAVLGAQSGSPSLTFVQRDGKVRVSLSAGLRGGENRRELAGLSIFDKRGLGMVQVGLWSGKGDIEDAAVSVYDGDRSEAEVRMRVLDGVPSVVVRDAGGQEVFKAPK